MAVNCVQLLGNVGADPEIRRMQNGDQVANLRLATSERWTDKATGEKKETTEWHSVVIFNQHLIPVVEQWVKKGSKIYVRGKLKTKKYQAQDGSDRYRTEVVIGAFDGELSLEGGGQGRQQSEHDYGMTTTRDTGGGGSASDDMDDEIPF